MKKSFFWFFLTTASLMSCSVKPKGPFNPPDKPGPPDYSKPEHWAALPDKTDPADRTPNGTFKDRQATAKVDVFFLHPTTYIGERGQKSWNASLEDEKLNQTTDQRAILNQASIFNGAGRVYAPRYRQAHLHVFYAKKEKEKAAVNKAYELAYQDIKAAFEYYLKHFNKGRPIIIASHSQGTVHALRLLQEFFDGTDLQKQLVAAYLIGWPVSNEDFKSIKVCESADETGCYCSWRTFKKGYYPKHFYHKNNHTAVTNPLTWTTDETFAPKELNEGTVLRKFNVVYPHLVDAQIHDGLLWVDKPKFPGSFLFLTRSYHIADLNFFYVNTRKNAQRRAEAFLKALSN